jgi:Inactive homolog of metal-dependent proteases, putative molecular chaperone
LEFIKNNELKLDAVAVSSGPGSYTGLRIGVSMAKGLCFGYGIPLIAVPTLKIIASKAISLNNKANETLYCAMLDARRMEVYASIFDRELTTCRETAADIITPETYEEFLNKGPVCFFGNGAEKCKTVITHPNAMFMDQIYPLAEDMALLAEDAFT